MNAAWRVAGIRLRAWIERLGWRDGAAAAIALALFAGTAWLALVAVPAEQRELQAASDAARLARRAALQATVARLGDDVSSGDKFLAGFPDASSRPRRLAQLVHLAEQHGLAWKRGEFTHANLPALALSRYQVSLPLGGRYEDLRAFVSDALEGDAAMSLDEWRLRRSDAGNATVQAELRFTLFSRAEPGLLEKKP